MGLQNLPRILTFSTCGHVVILGGTLKSVCLAKLISSESVIDQTVLNVIFVSKLVKIMF